MSAPSQLSAGLDPVHQKELEEFVQVVEKRSEFQAAVHNYTDICWDKCITKIKSQTDKSDEVCLTNCVERFLDTSVLVIQRFNEGLQQAQKSLQ
ncbi:uncharacterized protein BJ171DRAFT_528915 [Polychytrium aggregatum]|uniref:uncharacterized protein n=1 Tax=Polychytrium aggregatum TaxID=110093 RepID=UPI0022FED304|nr:uncharacterized protein BJ171DRAFT_528915 [Polychytrium aggregatum]KAI9193328.1 hypothetical protein BJ171DRAFT_528915 [Polychytrium aggregatum]